VEPFLKIDGVAVPVWRANVDTDAIIPIAFCVNRKRPHFDEGLFHRWRFDENGESTNFTLNDKRYSDPKIMIGGNNFGCGSSREMAVWALVDYGIRSVIAPSFGEIFFNNCFQNGVLPIQLLEKEVEDLVREVETSENPLMTIDLEEQKIGSPAGNHIAFDVNGLRKNALLLGLDPIEATLSQSDAIDAFQKKDRATRPWIYSPGE
tara:strand:+ start:242 stop:859 length:618 start_codon:yes stop_codon:yes gene_type:complete